jgi:hypothetical protein
MGSRNKGKTIVMVERLRDILAESIACTTWGYSPTAPVIWVGPKQITHGSFMRYLLYAIEGPDIIKRIDAGRETAVEAEDLVVDQCGKRQIVEKICKVFPDVGVAVFSKALVVEAVDLGDLAGLVIPTENGNALWVSNLQCDKKRHRLDGKVASIDIVTCEA